MKKRTALLLIFLLAFLFLSQSLFAYYCSVCRYTFSTPSYSSYTSYDGSAHWTVTQSKCPRCGHVMSTSTGTRIPHSMRLITSTKKLDATYHWSENYYRCGGCTYGYTAIAGKTTHSFATTLKWDSSKHWWESKCTGCSYMTVSSASHSMEVTYGQVHYDSTGHWWDLNHKCSVCSYSYSNISSVNDHERYEVSRTPDCTNDKCNGDYHYLNIKNICRTCGYQHPIIVVAEPHYDGDYDPTSGQPGGDLTNHWKTYSYYCLVCTTYHRKIDPSSIQRHQYVNYMPINDYVKDNLYHYQKSTAKCEVAWCQFYDIQVASVGELHSFRECCGCTEYPCETNPNMISCLNCYSYDIDPNDQAKHYKWRRSQCICGYPSAGFFVTSEYHRWDDAKTMCVDCLCEYTAERDQCN
jgi:hypothetical protein